MLTFRYVFSTAILISSGFALVWNADAQDTLDVASVMESLTSGEASELMTLADERVELALLGQTRRYSRAQALHVLNAFFRQYPPEVINPDHSLIQGGEWWLTGQYQVRFSTAQMRVYLRFVGQYPAFTLLAIQIIRL